MKKLFATAAILVAITPSAFAGAMTKDEIAKLPQDKVAVIKQDCAARWGNDFSMRIWCEDKQYKALQLLIDRNS